MDSTPVPVRDARCDDGPGTGAYAASKVPQVLSVGCGARGRYHVSPARAHYSRPLQIDASWRGYGRLADLADASRARLRACDTDDVRVVIRLQDHGTPTVDDIARGQVTHALFPGTARDARLADEPLVREGRAIDADGPVGGGTTPCRAAWSAFRRLQGMASAAPTSRHGSARGRVPTALAGAGRGRSASSWTSRSTAWTRVTPSDRVPARRGCMPHSWPRPSRPSVRTGTIATVSAAGRRPTDGGAAAHEAPSLAACRVLPVHRPRRRLAGS